jgi:DNA invertase Pin-like site-specific DNA recombinase
MTITAIIYARSSVDCSASAEEQAECLQAVAASRRWTVKRMFSDHPMPMKRGREQRPGETALLAAIRSGGVNKVLMFSIDRVGRSLPELVGLLETCREAGVEVYIHDRRIDTATSNGLSLFDFGQMGTGRGVRETARLSGISAASVSKLKNVGAAATT